MVTLGLTWIFTINVSKMKYTIKPLVGWVCISSPCPKVLTQHRTSLEDGLQNWTVARNNFRGGHKVHLVCCVQCCTVCPGVERTVASSPLVWCHDSATLFNRGSDLVSQSMTSVGICCDHAPEFRWLVTCTFAFCWRILRPGATIERTQFLSVL